MLPGIIQTFLIRELNALRRSVELYPTDDALWVLVPGITNSAGTLVLHLAGNLQHYVGGVLGGSGYVRDRPLEFSQRHVPRATLLQLIEAAEAAVTRGISALTPDSLAECFPEEVAGRKMSTGDFLMHLIAHLGYHLGQIDYHRRMVTQDARTADAVSVLEIPTFV